MSRFAKIDRRIHADAKVRRLTKSQPCGQALWWYLLTTQHAGPMPGVIVAGEHMLAEALGWSLEGFREAFREVCREGLAKADWDARLVWLPNATKFNAPESPNVIRSWEKFWDEVPECDLKLEAWSAFKAFTETLSEGFRKAFGEACPRPSRKALANQEQEQEQEQEQYSQSVADDARASPSTAAPAIPGTTPSDPLGSGHDTRPVTSGERPRIVAAARRRVASPRPPDASPPPGTLASSLHAVLVGDPMLVPIISRPGDLAQRLADREAFPGIDPVAEAKRAAAWLAANPARKKSAGDRFLLNWFGRAQERSRAPSMPGITDGGSNLPTIDETDAASARGENRRAYDAWRSSVADTVPFAARRSDVQS
jgi:hypothetical protein